MLSKLIRRRVTQGILCAMLFAQTALAVAACDWLRVAPAQALAAKASEGSCHEEPALNPNLCLSHCLSADQSSDTPQVPVPMLHATPVLVVPMVGIGEAHAVRLRYTLPHPAAPPARILFQTFLI